MEFLTFASVLFWRLVTRDDFLASRQTKPRDFPWLNTYHARFFRNWLLKFLSKKGLSDKNRQNRSVWTKICDVRGPDSKLSFWARDFTLLARRAKSPEKFRASPPFAPLRRKFHAWRGRANFVAPVRRWRPLRGWTHKALKAFTASFLIKMAQYKVLTNLSNLSFLTKLAKMSNFDQNGQNHRFCPSGAKPVKNLHSKANFDTTGARSQCQSHFIEFSDENSIFSLPRPCTPCGITFPFRAEREKVMPVGSGNPYGRENVKIL